MLYGSENLIRWRGPALQDNIGRPLAAMAHLPYLLTLAKPSFGWEPGLCMPIWLHPREPKVNSLKLWSNSPRPQSYYHGPSHWLCRILCARAGLLDVSCQLRTAPTGTTAPVPGETPSISAAKQPKSKGHILACECKTHWANQVLA